MLLLVALVSLVERVCRFTSEKSRGGLILPQLSAVQNVKQLTAVLSKRIPRAKEKAADKSSFLLLISARCYQSILPRPL